MRAEESDSTTTRRVAALQDSINTERGWPQTAPQLHAMHTIVEALAVR